MDADAMIDTPRTKRRFWQIHLSTVVVASLLAGACGYIAIPAFAELEGFLSRDNTAVRAAFLSTVELIILFVLIAVVTLSFEWWVRQDSANRSSQQTGAVTRPWRQLHSSTRLMMAVLAAGLIWLNVDDHGHSLAYDVDAEVRSVALAARGWPLDFESSSYEYGARLLEHEWDFAKLGLDIMACIAILAFSAVTIEWLTRRVKRGTP